MHVADIGRIPTCTTTCLLLLVLLVQLNCRLQFLEIKILLASFTRAVNVGGDLFVEFDTLSIDLLAIFSV